MLTRGFFWQRSLKKLDQITKLKKIMKTSDNFMMSKYFKKLMNFYEKNVKYSLIRKFNEDLWPECSNFGNIKPQLNGLILQFNMSIQLLAFTLLINLTLSLTCQPSSSSDGSSLIPLFEARSIDLIYANQTQRDFSVNVPLNSATTNQSYDVGVGLSYIQNYFDAGSLDFAVKANPQSSFFILTFSISQTAFWASVHIHYLATSRSDVRTNNFLANTAAIPISGSYSARTLYFAHSFSNRPLNVSNLNVAVRPYISGVRTLGRFIDVKATSVSVNTATSMLNFSITVANQTDPITELYLGYLINVIVNSPLSFSLIQNIQTYLEQSLIQNATNQDQNRFLGIRYTNSSALSQFYPSRRLLSFVILSQNLQNFIGSFKIQGYNVIYDTAGSYPILNNIQDSFVNSGSCITINQCINSGGFFAKNVLLMTDGSISDIVISSQGPGGIAGVVSETTDVSITGATISLPINSSSGGCILCRNNSEYIRTKNKCVCKQGYTQSPSKECIKSSTPPINCKTSFFAFEGNCYKNCSTNEYFNTTTKSCECIKNAYMEAEKCKICPSFSIYDSAKSKCVCIDGYSGNANSGCKRRGLQTATTPVPLSSTASLDPILAIQQTDIVV